MTDRNVHGRDGQEIDDAAPRRLGVREFRGDTAEFLRQARHGRSFLITSRDEVVAEIHPPSSADRPRRRPGAVRGRIRIADDFDTLPQDVLAAMEGETAGETSCRCSSSPMRSRGG